jgi:hypothetical protein
MNENDIDIIALRVDNIQEQINKVQEQVDGISKTVVDQNMDISKIYTEVSKLGEQVVCIKQDVIATISSQTNKIWELVNKGMKIIIALIVIICSAAGIKLLPEILNMF